MQSHAFVWQRAGLKEMETESSNSNTLYHQPKYTVFLFWLHIFRSIQSAQQQPDIPLQQVESAVLVSKPPGLIDGPSGLRMRVVLLK